MMKKYDHKDIEKKWQDRWEEEGLYKTPNKVPGKDNYYTLVEFSYPSGNLHVGHWYAFSVPDMFARYKRMRGYNSLYPMGFDSFGLPAERAAILHGKNPKDWTYKNMEYMQNQLRSMGASFDWDRRVITSDPEYYRWTQWMFNQFYKNDLAYKANTKVNWCPTDKTILANEQVIDGKCDRCGTEVEQKDQEQWMLKITEFADALTDDLDGLDWNDAIKEAQRSWIGRSEGSEISFKLSSGDSVDVFTTRADTLFGVTYVVLAPEHPLVNKLLDQVENKQEVEKYIEETKKKSELDRQQAKEKTGVELKGITATNPAYRQAGLQNDEEVPVWIADYVLAGYGTGAVMAVPAHDERDFEFANKYGLPIKQVIALQIGERIINAKERLGVSAIIRNSQGKILVQQNEHQRGILHSLPGGGVEEGENVEEALIREIKEETGYTDLEIVFCKGAYEYNFNSPERGYDRKLTEFLYEVKLISDKNEGRHLTDKEKSIIKDDLWLDHNEAIKILKQSNNFCGYAEAILMERKNNYLDGILVNSGKFDGLTSQEAREKITEFVGGKMVKTYRLRDWGISRQRYWGCPIPIVYDPEGNAHAVPDEHLPWLLPEDVDHTPDGTAPLARSKELFERTEKIFGKGWKPEVETMDTFVDSSWYFYRYLDPKNEKEFCSTDSQKDFMPIDIYFGGAEHTTMHLLYSRFWVKALRKIGLTDINEPYTRRINRSLILGPDGNKMSKSKGNVIDPDEVVGFVGADTVRMYLAFIGPYGATSHYPWDPNGVVGIRRFIERFWKTTDFIVEDDTKSLDTLLHKTIKKVTDDIERYKFNTAISAIMIFINEVEKEKKISKEQYSTMVKLLSPLAPHVSEEIWREVLGNSKSVHLEDWPVYDESLIKEEEVNISVSVNGKSRSLVKVPFDSEEEFVLSVAKEDQNVSKWIDGKNIKKIIFVPNKIINIITD
ncbi:class I tRNA ligase family protein [Candidatus Nomurabacteria bacterium]|nr:class I tRNA ligase family protein [Candidatus Nomurabacteria bacterium]